MPHDDNAAQHNVGQRSAGQDNAGQHNLYCTFRLGALWIGIDVGRVQEVLRHDQMTPVPLAPLAIRGLINLRGQIVTAVDLRPQLGLEEDGTLAASVVVRAGEDTFSLLVDEVGEVASPPPSDYEPVPKGVPERVREVVVGTYKLPDKLLLLLDLDRVAARLDLRAEPASGRPIASL